MLLLLRVTLRKRKSARRLAPYGGFGSLDAATSQFGGGLVVGSTPSSAALMQARSPHFGVWGLGLSWRSDSKMLGFMTALFTLRCLELPT